MTGGVRDERAEGSRSTGRVSAAVGGVMRRAFAVPSGPLGWFSTRVLMPLLVGPIYRDMAEELQLQAGDELLDVGCGSGAFLARYAGHVRRVAGIDLSQMQINLARRTLADRIAAGTAEISQGDASTLPWPDGSFTVVTSMESFEGFPDPGKALAEIFRVLRPGGRAVLNIGERIPAGTPTERRWGMMWLWADDEVQRMVEQAGFTDVSMHDAAAWGEDPLSKAFMRLMDRLGAHTRALRIVTAIKQ